MRQGTYVRDGTDAGTGVVDLAGGEVVFQTNGMVFAAGQTVLMLQQGYQLVAIGPVVVTPEVEVSSVAPTDPAIKLWMKV